MNMNIKIKVINHFTRENVIDSTVTLNESSDWAIVEANHKAFTEMFPDCYVNFVCNESGSAIFGVPLNQWKDEEAYDKGLMTYEEFCNKWYHGAASGCNEDMPDEEVERQIDMLIEEDWNEKDSICH